MVAAGVLDDRDGRRRDDNRPPRRDNRDGSPHNQKREWQPRQPCDDTRALRLVKDQLDGPCQFHGDKDEHGEFRSGHTLRNCGRFNELSEEHGRSAPPAPQRLTSILPGQIAHDAPAAPPMPPQKVAAIQQRREALEEEDAYPIAHGRICMIQEGRPSNRQQKQVSRQVYLAPLHTPQHQSSSEDRRLT